MNYDAIREKQAELLFTGKCIIQEKDFLDFKNYLINTKVNFEYKQENDKFIFTYK